MSVCIDYREQGLDSENASRKQRAYDYFTSNGCEAEITRNEFGDYIFTDNSSGVSVAYEYKTITDYINSVLDGSVFDEVTNQTQEHHYSFLVIVGTLGEYTKNNYKYRSDKSMTRKTYNIRMKNLFDGGVRRLRTICNVIHVTKEEQAFKEMLKQSEKCFKPRAYGGSRRAVLVNDIVVYTLTGCGGVGYDTATSIKNELGLSGLGSLLDCTKSDLVRVSGIGDKRADNIIKWIKGE